jgi:hypothetical protein
MKDDINFEITEVQIKDSKYSWNGLEIYRFHSQENIDIEINLESDSIGIIVQG